MDQKMIEAVKKTTPLDGFAREAINEYASKRENFTAGDALTLVRDAMKENCEFNFFGCNDVEGQKVAFDLEDIAAGLGLERPTCDEICSHGCCAYINQMLYGVGKKIYESENEA